MNRNKSGSKILSRSNHLPNSLTAEVAAYVYLENLGIYFCFLNRNVFRFQAVIARSEFDVIANEKDMIKAKRMLEEKEDQLFRERHYQPKKCTLHGLWLLRP